MDEESAPVSRLEALVEALPAILGDESAEAALHRGAAALAAVSGASASAVFLVEGERIIGQFWAPDDDATRARFGLPFARSAVEAAGARSAPGRTAHRAPCGARYAVHPFPAGRGPRVVGCAAWLGPAEGGASADDRHVPSLGCVLAHKVAEHHERAGREEERARYDRWFKTLDRQLRLLDGERQKFAAIVSQSDLWVFVADGSRTIRWTNKALAGVPGHEGAGWIGRACSEACSRLGDGAGGTGCAECPLTRALEKNEAAHQELRQVAADGARNLYVTALPIRAPDGRPTEVLVMIQDLTDLRMLRRSEARYRLLFERGANAIVMVEPATWRIVLANPSASRLLGYGPAELLRLTLPDLHPPREWLRLRERYASAWSESRAEGFECVLRGREGVERTAIANATRFDLEGRDVAMLEFLDVTERRRVETALTKREEQLRQSQKIEAVGRLAAGMAHDFNNLLSVIMGRSELMRDRLAPDDPLRRDAEEIHGASQRGAWLTRQLLAFSRQEVASPRVVDLRELVGRMDEMLRCLVGEHVELFTVPGPAPARVKADPAQIEQVVVNLVVNSREAMPRGGLLTVEVALVEHAEPVARERSEGRPAPWVMLAVSDNGQGMDEETRSHLFEPFFTTKEMGRGAGLGLSVVHGIVTRAGGHVHVSSEVGHGTAVRVYFPRFVDSSEEAAAQTAAGESQGLETVLLVEDDDAVRAVAREALEFEGYRVLEAQGGHDALATAERHDGDIHLMVTDVVMPQMGGGELAQRMALVRPDLRVLYISGYADDPGVRRGVLESGVPFLAKPFSLETLAQMVREVLDAPRAESSPRAVPPRASP